MTEPRTIRIGHDRAFLALSDNYENAPTRSVGGELWGFRARLRVPNVEASALVHVSESPPQDRPLPAFFAELAESWRGWAGTMDWRAHEEGLTLSCTHDGLGTISMATELRDSVRAWVVRAVVPIEAGQLGPLARDLEGFF